jgi:hypothetical protein
VKTLTTTEGQIAITPHQMSDINSMISTIIKDANIYTVQLCLLINTIVLESSLSFFWGKVNKYFIVLSSPGLLGTKRKFKKEETLLL